jgi:hypothetical protein
MFWSSAPTADTSCEYRPESVCVCVSSLWNRGGQESVQQLFTYKLKKLRGFSPQANYSDRAKAARR